MILTTGAGFIGLNTAGYLADRGEDVLLVRRHLSQIPSFLAPYWDKQIKAVQGDILELSFLYRLIKEYNVDSIIHLAMARQGMGSLYQTLKINVQGTIEVLEAARIFGLRRVTFCSSVAVYTRLATTSILHEDMDLPVESSSDISATKKAGEQICQLYAREYGLSVPIIRATLVWGPLYHSRLQPVQLMVENSVAGKPTDYSDIFGGGKSHYIYVKDCAKAISLVHLARSLKHNIYNVSDGIPHSLDDFAEAIREVIPEAQIKLRTTRSAQDVDLPPISVERIKEDVGFTADYDLKPAVRDYIDWLREGKY